MSKVINAGMFQSGNATQLQSVPISETAPTVGQVLKADAGGNWAPGTDSDSSNAVTLQGRAISANAPTDSQKLGWNNAQNTWEPQNDNTDTDATALQGTPVSSVAPSTPGKALVYSGTDWREGIINATQIQSVEVVDTTTVAPQDGWAIKYNAAQTRYEPSPDNNSQDATHIQNIPVDSATPTLDQGLFLDVTGEYKPKDVSAKEIRGFPVTGSPLADDQQFVYSSAQGEWAYQNSAGILTDGTRSYLKDPAENLGVGTASGLAGKIHAKNTGAATDCKIVVEADEGRASLHVRADTQATQAGAGGDGSIQIWHAGAPQVNLKWDASESQMILAADGSDNANTGLCLRPNGTSGRNIGDTELGSNSFGQVADVATLLGSDGANITTSVNASTTLNVTSGNGNLLKTLAQGDIISLSSAPTIESHIINVQSDTQLALSEPLGDGSAGQTIKVQKSIIDARNDGGFTAFIVDAKGNTGVGLGNLDPETQLHVGDLNHVTALLDSRGATASLDLRANSSFGTATGADRDTHIRFIEGTAQVEKGRITYSAAEKALMVMSDGTATAEKGLELKEDGRFGVHTGHEKVGNFQVNTIPDTTNLVGTDGANVTTTATNSTVINVSANGDLLRDLAVGDQISLSSAPADFAAIVEIISSAQVLVANALGDGTSQTISVKRAIATFFDTSGEEKFCLSPDGNLGLGTADPKRKIVAETGVGDGNCTVRAQSPDDQAILSLKANTQDVTTTGPNRDPSVNFSSGSASGENARIRYVADYSALNLSLKDTPTDPYIMSMGETNRGARVGIRQTQSASALSSKGLPTGQLLGNDGLAVTASPDVTKQIHLTSANATPRRRIAIGDRVAVQSAPPTTDAEYAYVAGVHATYFTTSSPIGSTGVAENVYLKPAHFRLEDASTTQDVMLVDSEKRVRIGAYEEGLNAQLNLTGTVAMKNAGAQTAPAGADLAHIYYRSPALGNDNHCKLLLHFDGDAAHGGEWSDSAFGSTVPHIVTSNGVTIDYTQKKFGEGSAYFNGTSSLIVDEVLGARGEFFPTSAGFTYTAWVRWDSAGTIQPLWGVYGTATNWQNICYDQATDTLQCYENTGTGKTLNWSVPSMGMSHSTWHYLMIAYESAPNNKVYVFVDGTLINSGGTVMAGAWNTLFSTAAINIGYDQGDSNLQLRGNLDELSWSNTSRQTASFVSPSEPFYAEGLYVYHAGRSAPYRLTPTGS